MRVRGEALGGGGRRGGEGRGRCHAVGPQDIAGGARAVRLHGALPAHRRALRGADPEPDAVERCQKPGREADRGDRRLGARGVGQGLLSAIPAQILPDGRAGRRRAAHGGGRCAVRRCLSADLLDPWPGRPPLLPPAAGSVRRARLFLRQISIAVRRGNRRLLDALDYGLDRLQTSGEFARIYRKFFPEPPA